MSSMNLEILASYFIILIFPVFSMIRFKTWTRNCSMKRVFLEMIIFAFVLSSTTITNSPKVKVEFLSLDDIILLISMALPLIHLVRRAGRTPTIRIFFEILAFFLVFSLVLSSHDQHSPEIQEQPLDICRSSEWEYPDRYPNLKLPINEEFPVFGINVTPEIKKLADLQKLNMWLKKSGLVSLDEAKNAKQSGHTEIQKEVKASRFRRRSTPVPSESEEILGHNDSKTTPEETSTWSNTKKILIGAGILYGVVKCRHIPAKILSKISTLMFKGKSSMIKTIK
jgi:hypothetical protein